MSLITKWQVSELDSPTINALREELNLRYVEIENRQQQFVASREELRKLIIAAKESREVAAIFFRQLNCDQIDCVLEEIAQAEIAPAFGTRLQDAIAVAEAAAGGKGKK